MGKVEQAGYSKRTLVDKLGIKAGQRVLILGAPDDYDDRLGALPADVTRSRQLRGTFDFIQFFSHRRAVLAGRFAGLKQALEKDGMLWVSWPKKASGVATDLTEDLVRDIGLGHGLVDVKVAAVDEVWSGLKFVYRREDR